MIIVFCTAITMIGIVAGIRYQMSLESANNESDFDSSLIVLKYEPKQNINPNIDAVVGSDTVDKNISASTSLPAVELPAPTITARAYIVADIESGEIYFEKNSNKVYPVASVSKLITALAATTEMASSTRIVVGTSTTIVGTTTVSMPEEYSKLIVGESFTLDEALYPLLLSSSNIMAEAIASTTYADFGNVNVRTRFLELMSSYAWEIGMPSSYFADASGLNERNMASVKDILELAKYLYKYRNDLLLITKNNTYSVSTTTDHGAHTFISTHPFVNDNRFLGGKTGRTKAAGETMLTILDMNGKKIAFIVLGSGIGDRAWDTRRLIEDYLSGRL